MYIYNYYFFNKGHELTLSMLLFDFYFEQLIIKSLNYNKIFKKNLKLKKLTMI